MFLCACSWSLVLLGLVPLTTSSSDDILKDIAPKVLPSFLETFNGKKSYLADDQWIKSDSEKYAGQEIAIKNIFPSLDVPDKGNSLVLEKSHRHYGIVHPLKEDFTLEPLDNEEEDTRRYAVLQYEVALTEGLECGGAYIKLLNGKENENKLWKEFDDKTGYSVMFGPDKCGFTSKVHLIIRHFNPKKQIYEEKSLKDSPQMVNDKASHLYTLVIDRKENTYEVWIDMEKAKNGSLFEDFEPSFQPPETIDDPNDEKPLDWVDASEIPDPKAVKPVDWDEEAPQYIVDEDAVQPKDWLENESETIPDPKAVKPEDWDDEEDGEWEAPAIPNPKCAEGASAGCGKWKRPNIINPAYKGKWTPPMIKNEAYKGEWEPAKIPNPDYYQVVSPGRIEAVNAVAFEIWTTTGGISFDNIWLGHGVEEAKAFAEKTWKVKSQAEKSEMEKENKEGKDKVRELTLEKGGWMEILQVYLDDFVEMFKSNKVYGYGGLATAIVLILTILVFRQKDPTISSEDTDAEQNPDVQEEKKEETEESDAKAESSKEESEKSEDEEESENVEGEESEKEENEENEESSENEKNEKDDDATDGNEEIESEEDVKGTAGGLRARKRAPKAD